MRRARHRFRGRPGAEPALVGATGLRFEARGHSERSDFGPKWGGAGATSLIVAPTMAEKLRDGASSYEEHVFSLLRVVRAAVSPLHPARPPGDLREDGGVYLKFVLSLDKPAHCAVTGRRGLGFDFFSPFCGCAHSLNQLYRHDLGTRHYDWRSFKRCCALAGLALHEVLPNQRPDENWTLEIDEFDLATRKDTKKASACPSAPSSMRTIVFSRPSQCYTIAASLTLT